MTDKSPIQLIEETQTVINEFPDDKYAPAIQAIIDSHARLYEALDRVGLIKVSANSKQYRCLMCGYTWSTGVSVYDTVKHHIDCPVPAINKSLSLARGEKL